jgi:glutamine amidotransferase
MCRLFGFRSVIPSKVHRSLLAAENALGVQSNMHPDGWGVAFYVDGSPHVTRSPSTALGDALFHRLSGVVSSQTVLAHVRKATQGPLTVLNCHPFQYGRWVFAHNGDVPSFRARRAALEQAIAPELAGFVLGETDSELIFFLVLSEISRSHSLLSTPPLEVVFAAMQRTVAQVRALADAPGSTSLLTFLLTDGNLMAAHRGGKELFFSTYKRRCGERESCGHFAASCESETAQGPVNHLVFSSEPLGGENIWREVGEGEVLGVGPEMMFERVSAQGERMSNISGPEWMRTGEGLIHMPARTGSIRT